MPMIDVTYPAGAFTPEARTALANDWGAAGNVVEFEQLRQAAAHERRQAGDTVAAG